MKLAEVSIRRPVFAVMMIAVLVVFGLFAYPKIGVDLFPSVDFPVVTATVVYPGADPTTMETKVADPIEESLQTLSGVKTLSSRNFEGVTQVIVQFNLEVDGDQAIQDVRDKVSAVERDLPKGVDPPVIQKFDTGAAPVLSVGLAGEVSPAELTRVGDKIVKQRLQQVPGVGGVELIGAREREIQVRVDPVRLAKYSLAVTDVANALQSQSLELPAGFIQKGDTEVTVTTRGEVRSPEEIGAIVVATGTTPVRVRDVADVVDGIEEARSGSYLSGTSALALVVRKQSGANTVAVAQLLRVQIDALRPELEDLGLRIAVPSDNAVFIERSIDDVKVDLILGIVLTVAIILLFLHDSRATFISAMAIPTSLLGTFAFMQAMGFTFNNVTMLALSLSIGILVDDAIVVLENIYRHLEMGKPPMKAAYEATAEIGFPVIATTLSIAAVFIPVAYMDGIIGRFFYQFGLVVSVAVLLSMFVSFTLTPMMSSRMLRLSHEVKKGPFARAFDAMFHRVEDAYEAVARLAIRRPTITLLIAFSTLIAAFWLIARVPGEFIPPEDRSQFEVNVELPVGSSLATTTAVAEAIAADVRESVEGVRETFTTVGGGTGGQVNRAKVNVSLVGGHDRGYSQHQLMAWVRERTTLAVEETGIEGLKVTVGEIDVFGGDSGFRTQPIQFSLRGSDMDELVASADALVAAMREHGGFVDLDTSYRGGKPEIAVRIDREAAASLNVPVSAVAQTLRLLNAGDAVTTLKEGTDIWDVIVQMTDENRSRLDDLSNLKVRAVDGQLVDLANVVVLERGEGPSEIERNGRLRQITVFADLDGIPLGDATAFVEAKAKELIPPTISTRWQGDAEMMQDSFIAMLRALGLAVVLVYMILAAQFNSLGQPIVIMLSLPFSFVGAFGGIYFAGMTLNIFSFIGIIMLMGLVTKAAILLVDFVNAAKEDGMDVREAVIKAGRVRLRPILMTAASTIIGMVPIALAISEGGETRAPMAVCVIGGMLGSTVLTLIVIPVVYLIGERMGEWRIFGGGGPKPALATASATGPVASDAGATQDAEEHR